MQLSLSTSDLCRIINQNGGAILDAIDLEDIEAYLSMKQTLMETDVSEDEEFQQKYVETFKVRGVRIKQAILKRYFELMEEDKDKEEPNLRRVCIELYAKHLSGKIKTNHLTFATYLINLIHDQAPIYDSGLMHLFGFDGPTQSRLSNGERINIYVEFYQHVSNVYAEVLEEKKVYDLLKVFEIKLKQKGLKLSREKRLELVVRATGELDRKGKLIMPSYAPAYTA